MKGVFWALLIVMAVVLSACSQSILTKNIETEKVCIPKYDINGNDLNHCDESKDSDVQDDLGDLDDLLSQIDKDLGVNSSGNNSAEDVVEDTNAIENVPETKEEVKAEDAEGLLVKTVIEGQLVELKPRVVDPDGDPVKISFSSPLDENGQWYTKEGDAGTYIVTVTADDGKTVSEQEVKIVVLPLNKPPVISINNTLEFKEGELIKLNPIVKDPEGQPVKVSFSGWMTSDEYQTDYDDAGTYSVTITASDGEKESSKKVLIHVINVNRAPIIEDMPKLSVKEGETITINPIAKDPDGDNITLTFSAPFDSEGKWVTKEGDAGEYAVTVTASDGVIETKKEVDIVVESLNKPPVLQHIDDIVVKEGETVKFDPVAIDPEGQPITITYSGWMNSSTYTTDYNDQGTHIVTVTVSDGVYSDSQDVKVIVEDVNRPPEFQCLVDCD